MNTNSNTYIFTFATIMVLVVAAILSFTALQLQPMQQSNLEQEKKQNILRAIHVDTTRDAAAELYEEYIKTSVVVDSEGNVKENEDAFTINMAEEMDKPLEERSLPVYINESDGHKTYIIPLRGKGLWGPLWGFMSIKDDFSTIYGATFDHKSETPGLGAEISTRKFQQQFNKKQLYNEQNEFVSVKVVKGGAEEGNPHQVDAISGGTITSNGLQDMIENGVASYQAYFDKQKNL